MYTYGDVRTRSGWLSAAVRRLAPDGRQWALSTAWIKEGIDYGRER
jgi:hypothetical protein